MLLSGMQQEHERAAGGWQAEWQAIPDLFCHTAAAVAHGTKAVSRLQVDADRMRSNMEQGSGLLMSEALMVALTPKLGRSEAQRVVEEVAVSAREQGRTLHEAAADNEQVRAVLAPRLSASRSTLSCISVAPTYS